MPSVDAVMKDYSDVFAGTEWDAANGRLVVLLASSAGDARLTSARAELADVKAKAAVEVQVVPRSRAELVAAAEKLMRIQARFLSDADAALYAVPQPRSGTLRVGVTARSVSAWEAITSALNLGVPIDLVEESTDQAVVPESRNNPMMTSLAG